MIEWKKEGGCRRRQDSREPNKEEAWPREMHLRVAFHPPHSIREGIEAIRAGFPHTDASYLEIRRKGPSFKINIPTLPIRTGIVKPAFCAHVSFQASHLRFRIFICPVLESAGAATLGEEASQTHKTNMTKYNVK